MNKVIFMGRLARDPEFKTLSSGTEVCNFSIAINRKFKRENAPDVDFFNCIAFSKLGNFINTWFKKGKMILITGNIQNRSWEDQNGQKHYVTEVFVESADFCGDKSESNNQNNDIQSYTSSNNSQSNDDFNKSESDDDLPF